MTTPSTGEPLRLPPEYGTPSEALAWADVEARLEAATHVWLATVRPDGRPHTVPVDLLWLDGAAWFGGSSETVKHRNLRADGRATLHPADAESAVIVEGTAELIHSDRRRSTPWWPHPGRSTATPRRPRPTPAQEAVFRAALATASPPVEEAEVISAIDELWARPEREHRYAGCLLASRYAMSASPAFVDHVARWITTDAWWDT